MRRIFLLFLVGLLAAGAFGVAATWGATNAGVSAASDDHDDDKDNHDGDDSGHGGDADDDSHTGHDDDDLATRTPAASTGTTAAIGMHEVHTAGERFSPATLTITAGESVTFVNDDDDEHTATGDGFDTGKMHEGDSVTITFDEPGTYVYVCQFHADMQAEIIVLPANGTPAASPAASPEASPVASPATVAERVEIDILNFEFSPATVTIKPGTTVVWTNASPTPHTVTGDFADSGILQSGDTFEWTFTDVGTFDYICNLHPQMQATIVVDPNAP